MIDPRIIQLLDSPDVERRKKAVMALAKTKDREALPYLARVYKNDKDPEVRDLARKGGVYIKKHMEEATAVQETSYDDGGYAYEEEDYSSGGYGYDDDAADDRYDSRLRYYDEEEDVEEAETEEDDLPMPSEIHVTPADVSRAQSYVDQAMDWNVRGNNEKAAQLLQRALRINPRLMHDSYTLSLAATVTGVGGDEAMRILGPSPEELRKRRGKSGSAASASTSGLQQAMALLVMIGAAVVLVGYFIMPWVDMTGLPTEVDGEVMTIGEAMDIANEQFNSAEARAGLAAILGPDAADDLIDAFTGLKFSFNGLDTTLLSIGAADIVEVMGLDAFVDAIATLSLGTDASLTGEMEIPYEPEPLDYTLPLIPVAAVLALLFGFLVLRGATVAKWLLVIIIGIMGIAPMMYFYLSAVNSLFPEDFDLASFGDVSVPTATDMIGLGFWVSFAGMLVVVILPFIALLLMPPAEKTS